ncbi:MAG: Asp-tRNA(Asn)/Glu-tRNA(Gln) amidotransferase GatCAB subunit C [Bacilli bacterium]|nr:Asp-tRNA(Asn)/Glu-tRNA(Gln) amidotransferase GatCAB subunit C [Bacilli bacterium]
MKEYNKDVLKDAANRLLFDMTEEEYDTLLSEFDIVTKQMTLIGEDPLVDEYEPMVFPFECTTTFLREDEPTTPLTKEETIKNANNKQDGQIKLPKVVL